MKKRRYRANGNPQCKACAHRRHDEIDAMLLRGDTPDSVSKRIGDITAASIRRHKANHLTTILPARLDHVKIARRGDGLCLEFGDIVNQVRELYKKAREVMDASESNNDHHSQIRANAQALRCLETYFKTAEATYKLSQASDTKSDMMDLSGVILTALADFPEAKLRVIKALQETKLAED